MRPVLFALLAGLGLTKDRLSLSMVSAALFPLKNVKNNLRNQYRPRTLLAHDEALSANFKADLRLLQSTTLSPVAADAYEHLLELTVDAEGKANPRVTCTEGYDYAADYVEAVMQEIGLVPMGNPERTSYKQVFAGSVDEDFCPPGMINLLGMVPGTDFADEFIVYNAHLDGPNNDNPQTDETRGIDGVSNAYDDGLAVAVVLAMAKDLMANPPARSVLIFIDDGEEGWSDVRIIPKNMTPQDICQEHVNSEWYRNLYNATGGFLGDDSIETCSGGLLGGNYWLKNPTIDPTIDPTSIQFMFVIDPLGSPYGAEFNLLSVLGGESVDYLNGTATSNEFLDVIWPENSRVQLVKAPRPAVQGYASNADSFRGSRFERNCGNFCLAEGGSTCRVGRATSLSKVPGVSVSNAKALFAAILTEGTFPDPAYFSVDDMAAFYQPNLDDIATTLTALVTNAANEDTVGELVYNDKGFTMTPADLQNVIDVYDILLIDIPKIVPPTTSFFLVRTVSSIRDQAEQLLLAPDFTDPQVQGAAQQLAQFGVGIIVSMDFFNANYPGKESFLDQTFSTPIEAIANEPFPTSSPMDTQTGSPDAISTGIPTTAPSGAISHVGRLVFMSVAFLFVTI